MKTAIQVQLVFLKLYTIQMFNTHVHCFWKIKLLDGVWSIRIYSHSSGFRCIQWKLVSVMYKLVPYKALYLWCDVLKEEWLTLFSAFYGFVCQTCVGWGCSIVKDNEIIKVYVWIIFKCVVKLTTLQPTVTEKSGYDVVCKYLPLPTSLNLFLPFFLSLSLNSSFECKIYDPALGSVPILWWIPFPLTYPSTLDFHKCTHTDTSTHIL